MLIAVVRVGPDLEEDETRQIHRPYHAHPQMIDAPNDVIRAVQADCNALIERPARALPGVRDLGEIRPLAVKGGLETDRVLPLPPHIEPAKEVVATHVD